MVDISAIGANKSAAAAIKKIDWQKCTPEEIKKFEKEGQQAPPEIVKWAAEIAKISNAPDDVTYEMVNGEVDEKQLAMLSGNGPIQERKDQMAPDSVRGQYEAMQAQIVGQTDEVTGMPFATSDQKSQLEQLSAKMSGLQNTTTEKTVDFSAEIKGIEDITKLAPLSKDDAKVNEARNQEPKKEAENGSNIAFGGLITPDKNKAAEQTKSPEKAVDDVKQNEKDISSNVNKEAPSPQTKTTTSKTEVKPEEQNDPATNDKITTDPNEILKRKLKKGLD